MSNEFETKLASAGEMFEKIAKESGLSISDFTEQEIEETLTLLMGDEKTASALAPGGTAGAGSAIPAAARANPFSRLWLSGTGSTPAPKVAAAETPKFSYGEVMSEVVKFASASGVDLTKVSSAELDEAVVKMAEHMAAMATPEMQQKQAALREKAAEADAMGRVMAHAYADELSKIAAAAKVAEKPEDEKEREEKEKAEKKAAFIQQLKSAGEMPEAFKKHLKGKDDKDGDKDDDKKEKEAALFAKQASLRAAEILISAGTNPETGMKFASEQERIDAGAALILAQQGYR